MTEPKTVVDEQSVRSMMRGSVWSSERELGDTVGHSLLLALAIFVVWFPAETRPWTVVVIAATMLALCTWGWRRTGPTGVGWIVGCTVILLTMGFSAASGWNPSRAVGEVGLMAALAALVWLASRSRPPAVFPALLAVGLAGLALWGLWQVFIGLEAIRPAIDELAPAARAYAEERAASRRAFASLPLPSHLAVMLATALPLLAARIRATPKGLCWTAAAGLGFIGLLATRSPVGLGLALLALIPILFTRRRVAAGIVVAGLVIGIVAVVVVRPDVASLEPVSLRLDNWSTGVWLWATSPASGVGVASFAQASQANPLEVGNRPAHAHSLPVEVLAELGPAGLVGVAILGVWLALLIRRLWKNNRSLAVAVAVVPIHNLVDFSIFVSGVAIPWAVLLGWAIAQGNPEAGRMPAREPRGRLAMVTAVCLALGAAILHTASGEIERAAAAASTPAIRFTGAQQALALAPWRVEPQFLLAASAIDSRDRALLDHAWNQLDRLRWMRPRSAALAERRSRLAIARGDISAALAEAWIAAEYGASESEQVWTELIEGLERTGHGPTG